MFAQKIAKLSQVKLSCANAKIAILKTHAASAKKHVADAKKHVAHKNKKPAQKIPRAVCAKMIVELLRKRLRFELKLVKFRIITASRKKLIVTSALHNLALVHH